MGIRNFFHKLKIGFVRMRGTSIPYVSAEKTYGNNGERYFFDDLMSALPAAKIKRNIIINTIDGNAEIDCLILYQCKLFAVEVKRWKGHLTESDDYFIQKKIDHWTGEIHAKYHKSPFKQLNRAIYLLRKQIPGRVWINSVVYFDGDEVYGVSTFSENVWFSNISDLVNYIKNDGKDTFESNAAKLFFDKCVSSDCLYVNSCNNALCCVIAPESLNLATDQGLIMKKDISHIIITHHFSYIIASQTVKK